MIVPFYNIYCFYFFLFRTYPFTTVASIKVLLFAPNNHKLYNYIKMVFQVSQMFTYGLLLLVVGSLELVCIAGEYIFKSSLIRHF